VPGELVPVVHAAASLDVAATMRRRLLSQLATLPTDPPLPDDLAGWPAGVEAGVDEAAERLGVASGAQLAAAEPRLRTALLPTTDKAYDVRRTVTSQVLVLMGAEGRLVRGRPMGGWTSRQHTWEPAAAWWPGGIAPLDPAQARRRLVEAYLRRFGPATEADVAWWTGWPKGVTRRALAGLEPVELAGGLVLPDDAGPTDEPEPTAVLLPALDPTPMGWKQREWFLPADPRPLYDTFGNVGPTVWWDGEVVGGWAVRPDGSVGHRAADRPRRLGAGRGGDGGRRAGGTPRRHGGGAVVPHAAGAPARRRMSVRLRAG
jgi:hypothetical protein